MLQPTSCGPGPPDKIFKFKQNLNETKDSLKKQKRVKQKIKEFTIKQQQQKEQQLYSNNNYNNEESRKEINKKHNDVNCMGNNVVNANDVCEESIKNVKNLQKKYSNNDNNNNYNCHLKNIKKLYANQIKATKLAPTLTTTAVTENNSALLYSNSNEATTVATTITATSKVAAAATATTTTALTLVAIEDKNKLKLKKKEDKIPTISSKFETFSVTVANVANNLNKFYKNFTTKNAATATVTTASTSSTSSSSTSTSTSIKWFLMFLMLFNILAQTPHQVAAEKSKHYYMQSLCKNHFLQQLYRKIDGAVLWSQNERNLDCIITFQTHSILQRFMLRFDMLQLDCNDHLYVYDGAHAVATPKIDISCRQTKQTVSSILTRTNFVTLKYVTDNWGTDANGFKLVITSVKDPKHTCKDFTCGSNGFCIHPDLLCDGINHCSDNSDESVHNLCQSETTSTVFGMDMTWFVMIVVSILLIISAAIVGITICVCRRQEETNNQQNTAIQLHHNLAETNGSSKHLHYTHGGTLTREHTQLPPTSGNWHHPAGPYTGYHRMQRNYLKMATKVRPILCLANFVN